MLDPANVPPVESDELLARFILYARHVRASDNTVKPDAFIPHPRPELSLTRHRDATQDELWGEGSRVSMLRNLTLHGRADVMAATFENEGLAVVAEPLPENPNHADAVHWPAEKAAQKMKALQIAARSTYIPKP